MISGNANKVLFHLIGLAFLEVLDVIIKYVEMVNLDTDMKKEK